MKNITPFPRCLHLYFLSGMDVRSSTNLDPVASDSANGDTILGNGPGRKTAGSQVGSNLGGLRAGVPGIVVFGPESTPGNDAVLDATGW